MLRTFVLTFLTSLHFGALASPICQIRAEDTVPKNGAPLVGPAKGSLFIHGGGKLSKTAMERFVEMAGGPEALIVVIPTAGTADEFPADWSGLKPLQAVGAKNLAVLHTRDVEKASSEEFIAPLLQAGGVWIGGGRQWRLADSYLKTKTLDALRGVLARGGVIGGSSAGATIQGSYLVRGAPEGPHIMISPGHEEGFGLLRNVAIDQHLLTRKRERDMLAVLEQHPELLGIGLDEDTAILVQGDRFESLGRRKVAIYDPKYVPAQDEPPYYFLEAGDKFDLAKRQVVERASERPKPPRPNVVLIVSDDQGYADLGCFGGREIKTPRLDRLAEEGVRLTSYYVTWPACTPSRGSLLTGRYPQRNGLYDMIRNDMVNYGHRYTEAEYAVSPEMTLGLDTREVTIAQTLHEAGYATGVVGKWDSGRARRFLPPPRGFDSFYGFANTGIDYWTHERYGIPSLFRNNERITDSGYATDLFRREAVKFIREHRQQPFFLYVPFNAPHGASNLEKDSLQVPEKYLREYADRDPKSNRTKYMAMVTCMDEAIGEILDTLRELKLEQNTLVLFHSDNGGSGPGDNGPLRGHKAEMFEGGLRVPCLARWPANLPAGRASDEFLTSLEVFPTLVAVSGAKVPSGVALDGFNMLPALRGEAKSSRAEMFWQRRSDRAARVGNYKWVESEKGRGLFDLANDLGEKHDLSTEQPDELTRVQARFAAWQREMEAAEPRGPFRNY